MRPLPGRFLVPAAIAVFVAATAAIGRGDETPAEPAAAATLAEHRGWVISGEYSRDGQMILTGGGDSLLYRPGSVVAWKANGGGRIGDFVGHPTAVWAARISGDGRLAATAGYDGLVKLWDMATRQSKHDLRKHKGWVRSVAFSPDGKRLATAGEDGTVVIWDTDTAAEVKAIAAHAGAAMCVAFSPDGQTIASGGSDKLVKLWNPATGEAKAAIPGHGDAIWTLAYSPDGSKLASGGADRSVRLWTTADGKEFAVLGGRSGWGHKDWVASVAFSPDGSRLASGSLDGGVKLWDVSAKGEQEGPEKLDTSVWSVAFAADGKTILVGSHGGASLLPTPAPKLLPPPPPPPPMPVVTTLVPKEFKSTAGASGAIAADGTVTVSGPLAKDTYTLRAVLPEGRTVTSVRLEPLADDSLPQRGPGRAPNGNFVLNTFAVHAGPPGAADTPNAVRFSAAKADYEQQGYAIAGAVDGNPETGWAVDGGTGQPHEATFTVHPETPLAPGSTVTITLDHQFPDGQHGLGKFRISVIEEPAPPPAP